MGKYTLEQLEDAKSTLDSMGVIRFYADEHLEKRGKSYVCPFCGSGNGPNKTPAFSIKGNRFKCFSCNESGDVLDLMGKVEGIDGYGEKVACLADAYGVTIGDGGTGAALGWGDSATVTSAPETPAPKQTVDYSEGRAKHRAYIEEMQGNVDMPEAVAYITGRGFTMEEAHGLGFGYDPYPAHGWQDEGGTWHKSGRIVIPWAGTDYYHVDRAISPDAKHLKYDKPREEEVGNQPPLYNPDALKADEVFVVEGLLDALALEVMGFNAIALAGTSYEQPLRAIASLDYKGTVVLMLDNDEAGAKNQKEASDLAASLGLDVYDLPMLDGLGVKDACEAMQRDRETARSYIDGILVSVNETRDERARKAEVELLKKAKLQRPAEVALGIWNCNDSEDPIPTGFGRLDLVTNGGLRNGLTIFGAGSSLGKTTLVSQICDHMARNGHPCLFISIEQSSREIVCKSLSRLLAARGYEGVGTWEMITRSQRDRWNYEKQSAFFDAYTDYVNNISSNLMIMTSTEQPTVYDIQKAAKMIRDRTGVSPCVFLDYLQLLAPMNERMSEKQAVDCNLGELRRLARDMAMPIVAISSINRTSYSGQIEFESFKESGGIEFSADLLIGLQPYRIAEKIAKVKGKDAKEKAARDAVEECRTSEGDHRDMELRVLKNRNGYVPKKALPLTFYPASSQFVDGVVG